MSALAVDESALELRLRILGPDHASLIVAYGTLKVGGLSQSAPAISFRLFSAARGAGSNKRAPVGARCLNRTCANSRRHASDHCPALMNACAVTTGVRHPRAVSETGHGVRCRGTSAPGKCCRMTACTTAHRHRHSLCPAPRRLAVQSLFFYGLTLPTKWASARQVALSLSLHVWCPRRHMRNRRMPRVLIALATARRVSKRSAGLRN